MKRMSALVLAATLALAGSARAATFSHDPPGKLAPSSGAGRNDTRVYAPEMRFPIESGPAFANSQVWGHGGSEGPGQQCDDENFSYPWRDNYCESRSWEMPLCPSGSGHQGQDIRAATCEKGVHWVVAAAGGTVTQVGSYSVYIATSDGTRFDYLHMSDVTVKEGQSVKRGDRIGKVSNLMGSSPTTVHLHFNIKQNVAGIGDIFVPPYTSLVRSYQDLLGISDEPDSGMATSVAATEPEAPKRLAAAPLPMDAPAAEDQGCATTRGTGPIEASGLLVAASVAAILRRRRRLA